jgi:hypothetical protein
VVRGIDRRSRIVVCPRWLITLMWVKPLLPALTRAKMGKQGPRFDALAESEAAIGPVGAGGEAERSARSAAAAR